jgi:hypothetical protein
MRFSSGGTPDLEEWYAIASSALQSDVITATYSANSGISDSLIAFGISGANTASPFDAGGPVYAANTATTASASITITHSNDMLLGLASNSQSSTYTAGAGFTIIGQTPTAAYAAGAEYGVVSGAGTYSVYMPLSQDSVWRLLADAVEA